MYKLVYTRVITLDCHFLTNSGILSTVPYGTLFGFLITPDYV